MQQAVCDFPKPSRLKVSETRQNHTLNCKSTGMNAQALHAPTNMRVHETMAHRKLGLFSFKKETNDKTRTPE